MQTHINPTVIEGSPPLPVGAVQAPIVFVGGFGFDWRMYNPVARRIAAVSGRAVRISRLTTLDWLEVVLSDDYGRLLVKLHEGVAAARRITGSRAVILVAHSAGGILSRIYLGDEPYGWQQQAYHGHNSVSTLVTLGTPHHAYSRARRAGQNQIAFANRHYPGAHWPHVRYATVMGRSIFGMRDGGSPERAAWDSYKMLAGAGGGWGDGIVPFENGLLSGAQPIILDDLRHDRRPDRPWYGETTAAVGSWWNQVLLPIPSA